MRRYEIGAVVSVDAEDETAAREIAVTMFGPKVLGKLIEAVPELRLSVELDESRATVWREVKE